MYYWNIYSTKEKAIKKKEEWDKNNSYQGAIIPVISGGDGIKRYVINEANILEYEVE